MVLVLMVLRHWAIEQRDRLEPPEERLNLSKSDWAPFGLFSMFLVMMAALACISFRWPLWIAAAPLLPLGVVAFVPEWRGPLLDAWFGKPVEPATRRPGELTPS